MDASRDKLPVEESDLKDELLKLDTKIKLALDECGACQGRATFLGWTSEQKLKFLSDIIFIWLGGLRITGHMT